MSSRPTFGSRDASPPGGGDGGWHFVCGMIRSGSTLIYQTLCAVLETRMAVGRMGFLDSGERWRPDAPGGGARVLKLHHFDGEIADRVGTGRARAFYSFRDPRDVAVSAMRQFEVPFETVLGWLEYAASTGRRWEQTAGVVSLRYEDFHHDLPGLVATLCRHVGLEPDRAMIEMVSASHNPDAQRQIASTVAHGAYDPRSLLHHGHIGARTPGAWKGNLESGQRALIEDRLGDWMRAHGYLSADSA